MTLNLYDRATAYIAASLIAVHPYLIGFFSTVYCETTYMTLALAGVYWSFRALRGFDRAAFFLAGRRRIDGMDYPSWLLASEQL